MDRKVPRLYLQVADQILEMIAERSIGVGERLPSERDLAEQLSVSRPTVREALIALEIGGRVEIRVGSGVYLLENAAVSLPLPDQGPGPFEILEARRIVEASTCALAAERMSADQLAELGQMLEDMAQENLRENMTEAADERFHCLIAAAAGNSALAASVNWLWVLRNDSEISTRFHQRVREEGNRPIIADHQAIYDALVARDPEAARRAMENHLDRVVGTLLDKD